MARTLLLLCVLASIALPTWAGEDRGQLNPIRKVVTLLQAMQKKVAAEGEKEEELYDKFMCYCRSGKGDLSASIGAAEIKMPAVGSDIEAGEGKLSQTKEDLKQAQVDRSAAKEAMDEATALREKEAAAYAAEKAEADANIASVKAAVAALEKGMSGTFLQTPDAQVLRRVAMGKQDMLDVDRQELISFLSADQGAGYAPQSGEITGILKELGDTMEKSLAEATAAEEAGIKSYEELMGAKTKETEALSASIETKTKSIGELGVELVQMKEDLSDTEAAMLEDQKFAEELETSCSTKTAEWEERKKTRADELVAIADTIKVLNDDDSLDLFKSTLPAAGASFVQVDASASRARARALDLIRDAKDRANKQDRPRLDLLALALGAKKAGNRGGFDKVIKMVDNMREVLKKEQLDDDNKKEYCNGQFDLTDDKRKGLERTVEEESNGIDTTTGALSQLADEIKSLTSGIKALDKSVTEATSQRQDENTEYKKLIAANSAAKQLLEHAKNRLNKFYNPGLYKPPPKQELSAEDRIFVNNGGTMPPTAAPGGIQGTGIEVPTLAQISAHVQSARRRDTPAPPPATWDAYTTKSAESNSVVAMVDLLIRDLDKEITEAETQEKNSQKDYEALMKDSAGKRSSDSKLLAEKGGSKANMEAELETHKENKASAGKELMATHKYIAALHSECDWLIKYHAVRKEARDGEHQNLASAKAILSGADYGSALLQTKAHGFLARA